jgi:hypothetical protein
VILDIILKYKEDMELLLHMERRYKKCCSDITLFTLQSGVIQKYMHLVTNNLNNTDINQPFNILDEYFDIQHALEQRLSIWKIPAQIHNDTMWNGLVANFIVYFLETSLL